MIKAYRHGDTGRLSARVHDDIDWIFYSPASLFPLGGARRGMREVFKGFAELYQAFMPIRYEVKIMPVDGDRSATLSNAHMEQRAFGRIINSRVANFQRFQDGLLIEYRGFTDSIDSLEQVLGREIDI